jgi:hypothetical protein
MDSLYGAARTVIPERDWNWLRDIKTRLYSAAPRGSSARPVITSVQLVDLGIELMEECTVAANTPITMADCVSAWNKDPVFGVIGIQSGPRG